ncbi:MAG: DUF1961 family protein [Planctomycetota bacterium]|jgi:hypothetical protein
MPIEYKVKEELYSDNFENLDNWHHEGTGTVELLGGRGMKMDCSGSVQGGPGCMAFFRPTLPDCISYEYDIKILSQGGLVINYIAIRGLGGEDLIEDMDKLPLRTGIMANYFAKQWGLQSYHVSFSRFNDKAEHTGESNWRRNPGSLLCAQGNDYCTEIGKNYHVKVVKEKGHCQLWVDNKYCSGFIDRNEGSYSIPDTGKFGFRVIGSDVKAEIRNFNVSALDPQPKAFSNNEDYTSFAELPEGFVEYGK